jgi:predicted porin
LGFKGVENLGNGLSAEFQLENGFSADTGILGQGGLLFGRQAFVGLTGKFGALRLGRQQTPVYRNNDVFDPFCNGMAGDSVRLMNYSGSRTSNMISYSLDTDGFRGQLQYSPGEVAGDSAAGRTVAGFVGYRKDKIDVVAAYQKTNDTTTTMNGTTTLIGGNYQLGFMKLYGAYAWNHDVMMATAVTSRAKNFRNVLAGATIPFGARTSFKLSYILLHDGSSSDSDSKQFAAGLVYDLSKRTALYASAARIFNDANASLSAGALGADNRLYNAGIRHWF